LGFEGLIKVLPGTGEKEVGVTGDEIQAGGYDI
jgi:hypothetical protein